MKCCSAALGLLFALSFSAFAADDPVQKAMKAFEKHRYEDAARELRASMASLPAGKQPSAQLALGMAYLRNAELHRRLHEVSVAVGMDYLKRVAGDRSAGRSKAADLYLGIAYLEGGKADAAALAIEKYLAGSPPDEKAGAVARIALGSARWKAGDRPKAQELWAGVAGDAEIKSELAAAMSGAGVAEKDPAALCDEAVNASRKGGKAPSPVIVKNCVGVYARAGVQEKAADLLDGADLRSHVYRESAGKSKVLSFYDPQLLAGLSTFYLRASIALLDKAAGDPQVRNIASYYLGEAHAMAGNAEQAARATAAFLGASQMPPQYRNRALVRQGALLHQKGKQADAIGVWDDLARSQPNDPDVLAEVLNTCSRLRIDCPRMALSAAAAVESGDGKRFAAVNIALGRYTYSRKDQAKAVAYLEAGRDKSNKNKIEFNDPVMLADLAEAYYRTKKFSEALEIYFEMSKQFPQVRQIQEALQGVYAMEHKSAGDVKIN